MRKVHANHGRDHGFGGGDPTGQAAFIWKIMLLDAALGVGDSADIIVLPEEVDGLRLVAAHASVTTVSSSGTPTVQLRNVTDAVDMLTTRITIDVGEFTSYTAAVQPVVNASNATVATGDRIACDIDVAGTGATGLQVMLRFGR